MFIQKTDIKKLKKAIPYLILMHENYFFVLSFSLLFKFH